jgi:uncharacterized protein DUF4411
VQPFVFDTSAFVNGRRDHYPPETFPTLWQTVEQAIGDGRVIVPRAVYVELEAKDTPTYAWARHFAHFCQEPSEAVQSEVGPIYVEVKGTGATRDAADPFVIAEGKVNGYIVVTYEGRTFSGVPTTKWWRKMPGICQHFGVECMTLPDALAALGLKL